MTLVLLLSLISFSSTSYAAQGQSLQYDSQEVFDDNWHNLSLEKDNVLGTGVEQVYATISPPLHKVIVAVIDSGVDVNHNDLQGKIWKNVAETPDNGIDDDNNGYVDDYIGWNFSGSAQGMGKVIFNNELANGFIFHKGDPSQQVECQDTAETRELRYLLKIQESRQLLGPEREKFLKLKKDIIPKREKALTDLIKYQDFYYQFMADISYLKELGLKEVSAVAVAQLDVNINNPKQVHTKTKIFESLMSGITPERLQESIKQNKLKVKFLYNYIDDPRAKIVGDDSDNLDEKYYGNNDIIGPEPSHGTGVAGIIAAIRSNEEGIKGIAETALIMPIRVLADGDERDKDLANAIYYAANNGAQVINISLGKYRSLHKEIVDKAMEYAAQKNIIIVNSAGNESLNTDLNIHYPNDLTLEGLRLNNLITVASSSANVNRELLPRFSNYGQSSVDLLAPGVMLKLLTPNNKTDYSSGTSFSAPIVSGTVALMLSYNPQLTVTQIKDYLFQTVTRIPGHEIYNRQKFLLTNLCRTGGIVNAYAAIQALLPTPALSELASN